MKTGAALAAVLGALALGCATTDAAATTAGTGASPKDAAAAGSSSSELRLPPKQYPMTKPAPAAPVPPSTPDAPFRATKPAPLAAAPRFEAPVPAVRKLKNGAEVWVIENPAIPVAVVQVVLRAGVNAEPLAKIGLSDMALSLLDEGTKTRTAQQLAEATEDLALRLSFSTGREDMRIHLNSLVETFPQGLDILADVLLNPAFRAEDVDRVRRLKLTALEQKRGIPGSLAADEMSRLLFGAKHPWGQPDGGTPETLKAITPDDLRRFHDTWFRPNNAILVVAGDVKVDEAVKLLDQRLGGWKSKPLPKLTQPAFPELKARAVTFVDKPNMSQSQVWVVGRTITAKHPDAVPLRTANFALGGFFTSRLNMNLREAKGYSYRVLSQLDLARSYGTMAALGSIFSKNTAEALAEYQGELDRFAKGGLTAEELARSKEGYIRTLPSRLETNDALAGAFATVALYELGTDYYQTLPGKIAAVTLEDVQRVAKLVQAERWPVIVVGPAAENADKVKALKLGPVEVKSVPGSGAAGEPVGAK